ncbi:MAG: 50S ribosomal protein L30 [Ruminococcaceae bacterium]|nr:50S ribosomal protein L30 [Oscillospiraceae bacterium]
MRIKLVKGFSGRTQKQKSTILSLGLRRIGDITVQPNNEATKGKIAKINHVIEIID